MKTLISNASIKQLSHQTDRERLPKLDNESGLIYFSWSSLLECLQQGSLFESLPRFDQGNPLFTHILSSLASGLQKEEIFNLFDQLFVECLVLIKSLEPIQSGFLLEKLHQGKPFPLPFSFALHYFEKRLTEKPTETIHDLILYLAFDRICVYLAIIFENALSEHQTQQGLEILRECLIESFIHIKSQEKTNPPFFRLAESLYAFMMREENLQKYPESEWLILCQSSKALRNRDDLPDVDYIHCSKHSSEDKVIKVFTSETPDKVQAHLGLTTYLFEKLPLEIPSWPFKWTPNETQQIG